MLDSKQSQEPLSLKTNINKLFTKARNNWGLAFSLAFKESGVTPKKFVIFVLCIAIASFALSSLTSILSSINRGVSFSAKSLLDGDLTLTKTYTKLNTSQLDYLSSNSKSYSLSGSLNATLRTADGQVQLIEIKAIDNKYPQAANFEPLSGIKSLRENTSLVMADKILFRKLGIDFNKYSKDSIEVFIGDTKFTLHDYIQRESDTSFRSIRIAPRLLMTLEGLKKTELIKVGSLVSWRYSIVLNDNLTEDQFTKKWHDKFPDQVWRFRKQKDAAPNLNRAVNRLDTFLLIAQLATLIIAGIGIANAFGAYIQSRRKAIAIWKCMGAESSTLKRIYIIQCTYMALWGLLPGLIIGNSMPFLLEDQLNLWLKISIVTSPSVLLILHQLITLGLMSVVFILVPFFQALNIPALELFRDIGKTKVYTKQWLIIALLTLTVAIYIVVTASNMLLAVWFILGVIITMLAFFILAQIVSKVLAPFMPFLLKISLQRPGSATTSVCMSIGVGVTILLLLALFQSNLIANISGTNTEDQPSLFLMNIQPNQEKTLNELFHKQSSARELKTTPILRTSVMAINGVLVNQLPKKISDHWVVTGSRIVTWSNVVPKNAPLIQGKWWDKDYTGDLLVSVSHKEALELKLSIDDTITIDLLGRKFIATVKSIHDVSWRNFDMNFVFIFSPGVFSTAPQSLMSTIIFDDDKQISSFIKQAGRTIPNVTVFPVAEVIAEFQKIISVVSRILTIIGGVCLSVGLLVLIGQAIARQKLVNYHTTLYRLCGASSYSILTITAGFYLMIGITATIIALGVSIVASYLLVDVLLSSNWEIHWQAIIIPLILAPVVAIATGLISAALSLRVKPFKLLRNN